MSLPNFLKHCPGPLFRPGAVAHSQFLLNKAKFSFTDNYYLLCRSLKHITKWFAFHLLPGFKSYNNVGFPLLILESFVPANKPGFVQGQHKSALREIRFFVATTTPHPYQ